MKVASVLLFTLLIICSCGAPVYDISPSEEPEQISASALEVSSYINYYAHTSVDIKEMKVSEYDGDYFLLAKGRDRWVYIAPLRESGKTLKLKRVKYLNACESGEMDIGHFRFEEDGISGCNEVNHKIMGK